MGIKGLMRWLRFNIKPAFIHRNIRIDTLFIDSKQLYFKSLEKADESHVIPIFLDQIKWVITHFTPTETLFLAMDGPNPAAKFQTQRQRKFQMDYIADFSYPEKPFDMLSKEQYAEIANKSLEEFLKDFINQPNIKTKRFLFSSGFAPGESEHKYFSFFREEKGSPNWKHNKNHFIYSNDNDLIFLSLQFTDENFYIVKFWEKDGKMINDVIDISEVRRYFLNLIYNPFGKGRRDSLQVVNNEKVINDIIALSFLLGNDFIPPFPEIESIDTQSFQKLLNSYVALNSDQNSNYKYLIENDSFSVQTLKEIVKIFFNENENQNQNESNSNNEQQREQAQMILKIFNFTWIYYSHGVPSWTFYYPYLESPSLKLAVSLMTQEEKASFEYDEIVDPYLKALVIHPATSLSNIPWNIYRIKIPPSPIADKYWPLIKPDDKVPMFNLNEIMEYYKKELATLSPEELYLNRRDPPYIIYTKNKFLDVKPINKGKNQGQLQIQVQVQNQEQPQDKKEYQSTKSIALFHTGPAPKQKKIQNILGSQFGKIKSIKTVTTTVVEFEQEECAQSAASAQQIEVEGQVMQISPLSSNVSKIFT